MAEASQAQTETKIVAREFGGRTRAMAWNLPLRFGFRLVFGYLVLYNLQAVGELIPGMGFLSQAYTDLWHKIVPWIAIHVFHLSGPVTVFPAVNGSGDTTLDYIQDLCFVVTALVAALVWSVLDRRRGDYRRLHYWLRLSVRYTLAFTLFGYGIAKVIPTQFIFPHFGKLIEPLGDFSPMGLLWYFMGYSTPYIIFSGLAEVTAGALLLFRRTTTLGAMAAFAVLLNVVMLNFCYDVPVKLYSTNLLLMAVFLMAPDLRRLADMLVFNRAVRPVHLGNAFHARWMRIARATAKIAIIGFCLFSTIKRSWEVYQSFIVNPPRPPIYGLYEVEAFSRNGNELPPLTTDKNRWKRVIISTPGALSVRMMDDSPRAFGTEYNAGSKTVALFPPGDKSKKDVFSYSQPDPEHVLLQGKLSGDVLAVTLRKVDVSKYLLVNRGFHWINERPFNR